MGRATCKGHCIIVRTASGDYRTRYSVNGSLLRHAGRVIFLCEARRTIYRKRQVGLGIREEGQAPESSIPVRVRLTDMMKLTELMLNTVM